jgi:hypothetical protein
MVDRSAPRWRGRARISCSARRPRSSSVNGVAVIDLDVSPAPVVRRRHASRVGLAVLVLAFAMVAGVPQGAPAPRSFGAKISPPCDYLVEVPSGVPASTAFYVIDKETGKVIFVGVCGP